MRVTVRAKPGSRKDLVYRDDNAADGRTLVVHVRARPVEGAASAAVSKAIAAALGVRARDVRIAVGGTSRIKLVDIDAPDTQVAAAILALPATADAASPRRG